MISAKNKKTADQTALEMACKSATHPLNILNILPSNPNELKTLPGETLVKALQTIAVLQTANKETVERDFITSHPSFELLCRRIRKCSTIFTPTEMIRSLRSLCALGVPTNSEISLVLLNLLRHEINHLTIEEIMQLDFVLSRTDKSSELQKAIEASIPIVFDLQISQQIDLEDAPCDLVKVLSFIASHKESYIKNKNIVRICDVICSKKDKINLEDAINIIYHLCAIDRFHLKNSIKLTALCIRQVMDHVNEVNITELMRICDRLVSIAVEQFLPLHYHMHGLLNLCCERISQENVGIDAAISLQSEFKKIVSFFMDFFNNLKSFPFQCV